MANDFLSQILGHVLTGTGTGAGAGEGAQQQNPRLDTNGSMGSLGDLLGGLMGGGAGPAGGLGGLGGLGSGGSSLGGLGGGKGALMAMLLPMAMQWVKRSGGVSSVLDRFQQKGYSQQAASWVSTGENESIAPQAINQVVGSDELSRLSQQLGVGADDVASGMAHILPQVVSHLTPQGEVPLDADNRLDNGISNLDQLMSQVKNH